MNRDLADGEFLVLLDDADLETFRLFARTRFMQKVHAEDEGNGEYSERWCTADGSETFSWIESRKCMGRFLWYRGPDPDSVLTVASHLLPSLSAAEVRRRLVATDPATLEELVWLLHVTAYVTPDEVPEVLEAFRRRFSDGRAEVRHDAVRAYGIRRWPSLLPDVERIASADPAPEVREFAGKVGRFARAEAEA